MLADDDILSCQKNISDFFTHCHCLNAKIAQPALMSQSFFTHIITIENKNFLFRNTSFVEIMVPCFRRDILEKLLHTFSLGHTGCGWGLDNLWPKLIDFDAMFIIDDTPLLHTRPLTSQQDKEAEKKLLSELYRVTNTHNINADYIKTFSGTLRNRATIMENAPEFLGVLLSGYSDTIARTPAFALQLISRQYIKNEL
ncbi:hypothetical protein [Acetobacter oeni]|nr:hypothetical protein [Acetobacter oeni]MBB3882411.1 hypothetical protein [Acetobacter oeni]NHO18491.1 hypothetical protein [Acetobacter oeni]